MHEIPETGQGRLKKVGGAQQAKFIGGEAPTLHGRAATGFAQGTGISY